MPIGVFLDCCIRCKTEGCLGVLGYKISHLFDQAES